MDNDGWIDISVPLRDRMAHWPDDPAVRVQRIHSIEQGDPANLTQLSMSAHTGTHMDAPSHYLPGAESIDMLPFAVSMGPARVLAVASPGLIPRRMLESATVRAGERLLLKTPNSDRAWAESKFDPGYTALSAEAAHWLASRQIRLLGIDYLSVGPDGAEGTEVHRALLGAGIWIVEGLNLAGVEPGRYELVCLPLHIAGADGAPARALLRPLDP